MFPARIESWLVEGLAVESGQMVTSKVPGCPLAHYNETFWFSKLCMESHRVSFRQAWNFSTPSNHACQISGVPTIASNDNFQTDSFALHD